MEHIELVADDFGVVKWYWAVAVDILLLAIVLGVGYIFYKDAVKSKKGKIDTIGIPILTIIVAAFLLWYEVTATTITIDVAFDNIAVSTENIVHVYKAKTLVFIDTEDNDEYYFSELNFKDYASMELEGIMEEYYVGNLCEIEYYKWSKRIIRITLVD